MDNRPLVLVADDEPQITKLVAMTLTEEGFRVVTARNGEEAIDKVASLRPDVVLLDIVMPGMSGIDVMNHLREWHPVPVILLTARTVQGRRRDRARRGRRRLHPQAAPSARARGPRPRGAAPRDAESHPRAPWWRSATTTWTSSSAS